MFVVPFKIVIHGLDEIGYMIFVEGYWFMVLAHTQSSVAQHLEFSG